MSDQSELYRSAMETRLASFNTRALLREIQKRGIDVRAGEVLLGDEVELERLADAIASGDTRHALDLLKEMAPHSPEPSTTLFLRDCRAPRSEV